MKSKCLWSFGAACVVLAGCGGEGSEPGAGSSVQNGGSGGTGAATGTGATAGIGGSGGTAPTGGVVLGLGGDSATGGFGNAGGACAAQSAEGSLRPVVLAFVFDVSSSMGKHEVDYADPALKWQPVVAATEAFFAEPDSAQLSASLTFFPAAEDLCTTTRYAVPDVPLTPLPSAAFASAIQAITPQTSADWRSGTPTLAAVQGTLGWLEPLAATAPDSVHVLVLVTDGTPTSCDDNSIESVSAAVSAVSDRIPTYVIGVRNPPGGPDTVSDLQAIAVAGGTENAFMIETGNPEQTKADFKAVIDDIRGNSVSCEIEIPPPPEGEEFDSQKVNVTFTNGTLEEPFAYDPECAGGGSWHYDDPAAPTAIELCPATCAVVQADPNARLLVEFGCATRIPQVR